MSQKIETITPPAAFTAQNVPTFEPGFVPDEYELENLGATVVVYSFDGPNEVGGSIPVAVATNEASRKKIRSKGQKLWLRDGAGTGSCRVIARTDA